MRAKVAFCFPTCMQKSRFVFSYAPYLVKRDSLFHLFIEKADMTSAANSFKASLESLQQKLSTDATLTHRQILLKHLTEMSNNPNLKQCLQLERSSWNILIKQVTVDNEDLATLARIMRRKLQHRSFNEKRGKRGGNRSDNTGEPVRKRHTIATLMSRVESLEADLVCQEKRFNADMNAMQCKLDKLERQNAYLLSQINPDKMPPYGPFNAFQYVDPPHIDTFLMK